MNLICVDPTMSRSYTQTRLFFLVVLAGLLTSAESTQNDFATKEMVDNILREIQNLKVMCLRSCVLEINFR